MKLYEDSPQKVENYVASFSEAWIEIKYGSEDFSGHNNVASFSEAWIEIEELRPEFLEYGRRLLLGGVD